MTNGYSLFQRPVRGILSLLILSGLLAAVGSNRLMGQAAVRIENAFSSVSVVQDQNCGKFWFATGSQYGYTRYLYRGGGTSTVVTSHVVFRIKRGSEILYYCNTPENFANGGVRPQGPNGNIPFEPYDSLYVSPGKDTIEVIWKDVNIYDITMRFVAEAPRNVYDDGADILLEFQYRQNGPAPPGTDLGIFLMLDGDNGTISNGIASDHSSVLTDQGYYSTEEFGKSFQKAFGGIPEYCMTGWFEYTKPLNDIFSLHRLVGTSLGGAPLTTPDAFAIGNWKDFRSLSWNFNSDLASKQIGDVATAMRWENLGSEGMIRTAFGTTSKSGNNLFHCRDSNVFVALRTQRVVKQDQINGPYSPGQFDVEVWVSSLKRQIDIGPVLSLELPIASYPSGTGQVTLDPSTPQTVTLGIRPRETKKITWRINVNQAKEDTMVAFRILYRDSSELRDKPLVPLKDDCIPLVNFKSAFIPPPPDDRPPVVESIGSGRDQTAWWTFRTFDRHAGFQYDLGLDRIEIVRNDGGNFRLIQTPDPFVRCDTTVTVNLRAEIIDTTKPGNILFRVYDCKGNTQDGSAGYTPRPDIFNPDVVRIDSLNPYDAVNYPCAVPKFEVYLEDQTHQNAQGIDAGFGSITVLSSTNFDPIEINFDKGGTAIQDFDPTAAFRLQVTDPLQDGDAVVRVADYAGNSDTLTFHYCTIPDTRPPVLTSTPGTGNPVESWTIDATDKQEWDRGLANVVEISNTNMQVTPWPIPVVAGQPDLTGVAVNVVDDAYDGEITLEYRDTYYDQNDPATFASHSAQVQFKFTGIPDTMAPDIFFRRDLTVPSTEVVFNVAVRDTHFIAGNPYKYDHGIRNVTWTLTPNMRIRPSSPIVYTDNGHGANFQVEIIDPLAIVEGDTVCVTAVDSAGNRSSLCQAWPNTPDGKSPIFVGRLDPTRMTITGTVTDDREFDRGLGAVLLRSEVNLNPYNQTGIAGAPTAPVSITVIDPEKPIAGEIVIRDLVGELEGGPEQSIHTVVIPFALSVASVAVSLPDLVEGGEEIAATVKAENAFNGDQIESLLFDVNYSANGTYLGANPGSSVGAFTVTPLGSGALQVQVTTMPGKDYVAGDLLGTIRFGTPKPYVFEKFTFGVAPGSMVANGGTETVITVRTSGDPLASELTLPAPFFRAVADSQTVINGECNRALTSSGAALRPTGLAILGYYPQPVGASTGTTLTLLVRDLPSDGGHVELISVDGIPALQSSLPSTTDGPVSQLNLTLPGTLARGLYFLRISGSTGIDQVKVLVVE